MHFKEIDERSSDVEVDNDLGSEESEKLNQVELDKALLSAYRAGDAEALRKLIELHYSSTIGWAKKYSRDDDPEDLVQQAVLKMIEALAKGVGPSTSVGLYLASTVRNLVFNLRTTKNRYVPVPEVEELAAGNRVEYLPEDAILTEALGSLSKRDQQLLWWRDVEMIPPRELSKLLDMTPSAVSMAHTRAVTALGAAYRMAAVRYSADVGEKPLLPKISKARRGLPIMGAAGLLSGAYALDPLAVFTPPAVAAVSLSRALPLTLAGVGTVAAVTAGVLYLTSQPSGVVFPVPGTSGESAMVVQRVLDSHPGADCTLNWYPNGSDTDGQPHFHLLKSGKVACSLTVSFDGETLASLEDAPNGATVLTPQSGDYTIFLTAQ